MSWKLCENATEMEIVKRVCYILFGFEMPEPRRQSTYTSTTQNYLHVARTELCVTYELGLKEDQMGQRRSLSLLTWI